jgi:hypothetical protein
MLPDYACPRRWETPSSSKARRRGRGSRYCPGCLADTGGRWQLRWRLTWSFACTTHRRLLADTCPACDSIPGFRASESHLPPSPGYCEAPVPLPGERQRPGRRRHQRCGTDLAQAPALQIPPGHPVLAAQQILDQLIDGDTADFGLYTVAPQPAITALADLRAIAGRVMTYAPHREIPGDMSSDSCSPNCTSSPASSTPASTRPSTVSAPRRPWPQQQPSAYPMPSRS